MDTPTQDILPGIQSPNPNTNNVSEINNLLSSSPSTSTKINNTGNNTTWDQPTQPSQNAHPEYNVNYSDTYTSTSPSTSLNNVSFPVFTFIRKKLMEKHGKYTPTVILDIMSKLGYYNDDEITHNVLLEAFNRAGIPCQMSDIEHYMYVCENKVRGNTTVSDIIRSLPTIRRENSFRDMNNSHFTPESLMQMRTTTSRVKKIQSPHNPEIPAAVSSTTSAATAAASSIYRKIVDVVTSSNTTDTNVSTPVNKYDKYDVEDILGQSYIDNNANQHSSNALDVLALYIKGQKLLYTESKTYCEQQLNFLMLPAIFISCVGSILSFLSTQYEKGDIINASLNGFNAFLLALISYLKLDAKAQAHKTSAYKFDKLESMCEFNSGKFMFFESTSDEIINVVNQIEKEVKEIKETNQFILPESIRYEFIFTYSTNIFMEVKKIQSRELSETNKMANLMRKLKSDYVILDSDIPENEMKKIQEEIEKNENKRDKHIENILQCKDDYYNLDRRFNEEIDQHIRRANKWNIFRILCCDWLKS